MEVKDVLPLLGVAVGWLLKELSDYLRQWGQNRKEVGRALVGLLQLSDELQRLNMMQEVHKVHAANWQKYERLRVRTAKRYMARTDPTQSLQAAIEVLGGLNPLDAVDLRNIAFMLALYPVSGLDNIQDSERYLKLLSTLEVSYEMSQFALKKMILKLAWVHGFDTWVKVQIYWRGLNGKLAQENKKFTEDFLSELFEGTDDQRANQPTATADRSRSTGAPPEESSTTRE